MQKCAHLVELEKCCQTYVFLQKFILTQLRTSPPKIYKIIICKKFANFAKFANPNHAGLEVVPALPDEVRVRAADPLHRRGEGRARLGYPGCGNGCMVPRGSRQTWEGSFSAVAKPNFASKYALESSRRDLHNALLCTALNSHFFQKFARISPKFAKLFRNFAEIYQILQIFKLIFR